MDYDNAQADFERALRGLEGAVNPFVIPIASLIYRFGSFQTALTSAKVLANARSRVKETRSAFIDARVKLAEAKRALAECLHGGLRSGASAEPGRSRSGAGKAADCTNRQVDALVNRARALKLPNFASTARKIAAELKAKQRAQAVRDLKRLRTGVQAELKQVRALEKALKACR